MWHLLRAHQQESFLPFSSRQSLSCCLSPVAKRSTPKPHGPLFPFIRTAWTSIYLLQNHMALFLSPQNLMVLPPYPLASEPHGSLLWLPGLGLNPSAHLPLQPHFRPLLQSVTPASILVFFQLYWAAVVSPGRCGPMAWSQSSPSSHAGPVTRGSCFPVPPWVEVTPISLAQSRATAI